MNIRLAGLPPVYKFDPQLKSTVGELNEVVFVNAQQPVKVQNVRNGCFAHAYRADLF